MRGVGDNPSFRADIEGLRAVAVSLVVLDHMVGWPVGGFVGVDIFFVVSGFLITGLLLKEHDKRGRISFVGFYRRRIRRILPMSTLVIAVTVAASMMLYFAPRADEIRTDGLWALLFSANWRFHDVGVDYFSSSGSPSPLQHYWSLAVEEQYYFMWPWLLAAALPLLARLRLGWRPVVGGLVAAVTVIAAFGWSLHESSAAPMSAYFSTFSRAWELLAGAVLAIAASRLTGLGRGVRAVLGWGGLAAILLSAFVVRPESSFPAPAGLLPVLGTVAVIAAGSGGIGPALGHSPTPSPGTSGVSRTRCICGTGRRSCFCPSQSDRIGDGCAFSP